MINRRSAWIVVVVAAVYASNECNPSKGCNVCAGCCQSWIQDGSECDGCVKAQCKSIPTSCKHGGHFDSKTGKCVGCIGAWSGDNCTTYNAAGLSTAKLLAMFSGIAEQSQAMLDAQQSLNPLCKQGEVRGGKS